MRKSISLFTLILISGMIASCCSTKKAEKMKPDQEVFLSGPNVIIYQMKRDYSKLVPVILSNDKTTIESYPDIKDIYVNGNLAYPIRLHNNYWLDNRGINPKVAFINLTYEEYSKLPKTPLSEELLKIIIDTDPIVKMYSCGLRSSYQDIELNLNAKIDADDFSTFNKIK